MPFGAFMRAKEIRMFDLVMLAAGLAFFIVAFAYVRACERLS